VNNDFEYSSGAQREFFSSNSCNAKLVGPDLVHASPNDVADPMSEHQPALLERARFSCTPYVVWYQALLEACGPDGYFWMRGNSQSAYDARGAGYVHVERGPGVEARSPFSNILNGEREPWATACVNSERTVEHFAKRLNGRRHSALDRRSILSGWPYFLGAPGRASLLSPRRRASPTHSRTGRASSSTADGSTTTAMTLVDSPPASSSFATMAPSSPEPGPAPTTRVRRATGSIFGSSTTDGRDVRTSSHAWPGCAHAATASTNRVPCR